MELRVNFDDLYQELGGTRQSCPGLLEDDPVAEQASCRVTEAWRMRCLHGC